MSTIKKTTTTSSSSSSARPASTSAMLIKNYLTAYNLLSFFGWVLILSTSLKHMISGPQTSNLPLRYAATTLSRFRPLRTLTLYQYTHLPPPLAELAYRGSILQQFAGALVAFVQNFAILEVVHAALGWVRSPVPTTAMQVASRLFLVWGVSERYAEASTSPFYAPMVLAWSITECIRYAFYASQLLGGDTRALLWLRYTTFYILYPIGAASEAILIYVTLPKTFPWDSPKSWHNPRMTWTSRDYVYGGLVLIWLPGLYVMYTHMIRQRRKAIGKGFFGSADKGKAPAVNVSEKKVK